jgi:hypothetical protein
MRRRPLILVPKTAAIGLPAAKNPSIAIYLMSLLRNDTHADYDMLGPFLNFEDA